MSAPIEKPILFRRTPRWSSMTEKPVLFSAPMVRAILAGQKSQTRRLIRLDRPASEEPWTPLTSPGAFAEGLVTGASLTFRCPYGKPGTRLWVRESWCRSDGHVTPEDEFCYRANLPEDEATGYRWRPSIYMPREASRITLEVTEVRAQRLQEISEEDAKAEGFSGELMPATINGEPGRVAFFDARQWFGHLWDAINGKRPGCSWADNPWIWAVSFKVLP